MGMALRGYCRSPRHDEPFIESHLDIRDALGNGRAGLRLDLPPRRRARERRAWACSRSRAAGRASTRRQLMDAFIDWAPAYWGLSERRPVRAADGREAAHGPVGRPRIGPNVLVIGDAAGAINPFNGEGIAYGYETGRLAAACVARALSGEGVHALVDYESQLDAAYGLYFRVARDFVRLISRPEVMQACVQHRHALAQRHGVAAAIMANLLRPDELGPAEAAYRALATIARITPG